MKKIGIFICGDVAERCTANGCLRAFNEKNDAFERYSNEDIILSSFNTCIGCEKDPLANLEVKIEKFLKAEIEVVHLSTCIRGRCDHYEAFAVALSQHFDVVGYTHGSKEGKKKNNITMSVL